MCNEHATPLALGLPKAGRVATVRPMKRASRVRRRRWISIVVILVVLFTLVGFFVIPPIARSQLETRLSAQLGRRVTVEKVRLNPYTMAVTLENFAILEADNTTKFLGWRRLFVNADPWSSWKEWVVSEIALDGFESRVAINADSTFNFSDLLTKLAPADAAPKPAPEKPAEPARAVRIGSLRVADARVDFSDRSRAKPFETVLGPLTFALNEFRTISQTGAPYRFEAMTESGEKLSWAGTLRADPPASTGELVLENIVLAKYAPYYADYIQADVVDGKLSVRGQYDVSLADGKRVATLRDGSVQLSAIKVVERGTRQNAIEVPALVVTGIQADALTQKASIGLVALNGGQVRARREKDGTINLLRMLQPPPAGPGQTPASPAAGPGSTAPGAPSGSVKPDVTIGELALKDFRIEVLDEAAPRPATLALSEIQFSVRNVTLAEGAQMPLQLAFTWAPQGAVRLDGNVAIAPLKADLTLDVASLDLLPVSPYLEQFANVRLTQGALTTGVIIEASLPEGQPPAVSITGGAKLEKLGLVDGARNEELAGFGDLTLQGLRATTTPELSIALDEIKLAGPFARVVLNQDKTLNLASVLRSDPAPEAASTNALGTKATDVETKTSAAPPTTAAAQTAATPLPKIQIGKVVISEGDFRFNDRSLEPNVTMAITKFGGTIAGLSSSNPAKADLDLRALVDGAGPIAIAGKIDPLGATKTFDLKVDFKNVDLVPLSPYSGRFAGYELARGKLLLDVKLDVNGNRIDAANVITLNQFTFGSPVKSAVATSLPVRLGVALLKDMDGKIVIDVPVQGSTDDPSFKVGRVVMRVIVNLLTKAAVSPFALLGSAFGGGGDELAYQEFAAGSAQIRPDEVRKLETMVKALTNRPGLSVALQGSYDALADMHALKELRLAETVRRAIWEQKRTIDPNTPPPDQLVITSEEEATMLKKLYDEKFPPGTRFGAPVPPPPEMTPLPPPPTGFLPRLVAAISGRAEREEKAVQEENARRVAEHAKAIEMAVATGLPIDDMRGRLLEETVVDGNDLRALAQARAESVRDYFANVGKIAPDRLFLAKDRVDGGKDAIGARVTLELQ